MITQNYKLNIIPRIERSVRGMTPPTVNVSQYDKGLRTLVFDLYDGANGRLIIQEGQTAKLYGKKPDANVFEYDMTIGEDMQSVSIVLQEQMAVVAGCVECEVRIIDGSSTVGSANFILAVEKAPVGADEVYSESEIPEIDNLLYGGNVGDVFTKTKTGARWAALGTDSGVMMKSEYDPNDTGSVLNADHADDAGTVDGHTVARDVLVNEYTNEQIDSMMQVAGTVKTVNSVQPDQNGDVQLSKADLGLGNVDNTSDADKPISTAAQDALDQKVDKVPGMGLSQNSFTDAEKEKLGALPTSAELTAELSEKVDKEAGKGLSTEDFTTPEKTKLDALPTAAELETSLNGKVDKETGKGLSSNDFTTEEKNKLAGIEAGAQVNTITGVKGDAEASYRTGNVNVTKENIGLGNVDNTSDLNKPISTATQAALDLKQNTLIFDDTPTAGSNNPVKSSGIAAAVSELNEAISEKVSSVNSVLPDSNGNVEISASDIPANGMGTKETSGNPIEIEDGVAENAQDLSVELEPIQDLHGYDHPWAGGAGKNLIPMTVSSIKQANSIGTWNGNAYSLNGLTFTIVTDNDENVTGIRVDGTASSQTEFQVKNSTDITLASGSYIFSGNGLSDESIRINTYDDGNFDFRTATSQTFTVSAQTTIWYCAIRVLNGANVSNVLVQPQVELGSSATSFEPYSNICPISGRTAVDVLRTGFNQWDEEWENGYYWKNSSGELIKSPASSAWCSKNPIKVIPGETYYILTSTNADIYAWFTDEDMNVIGRNSGVGVISAATCPVGAVYMFINQDTATPNQVCINISDSAKNGTYEPYQGQSVTVQLGDTVYGGTLDVTTGELVVDRAIVDLGTLNWSYSTSSMRFVASFSDAVPELNSATPFNGRCSIYQSVGSYITINHVVDGSISLDRQHTLCVYDSSAGTNATAFKTAMSGVQLVYELATPQTIQLTAQQLALLEGYNILTTNGDTINLRYIGTEASNVQAEIDEFETVTNKLISSIAFAEQSTAITNHAVGDYIVLNGQFCVVTAAIATGESIIINTNASITTVGVELLKIIARLNAINA